MTREAAESLRLEALRLEALRLEALRLEALRLNDRYLREVVIGFGLCPWAERAIDMGEVRRAVILDPAPGPESALAFIDQLEAEPTATVVAATASAETIAAATDRPAMIASAETLPAPSIGLLIFPRARWSLTAFDRFTEAVRRADRARRSPGQRPAFLAAAFHPDGAASFETAPQLVSFLRRTPDPTIQLVRAAAIDRVSAARPSLSDEIARQNHATVLSRGTAAVEAILRAIHTDRDQTYAALAAVAPQG